MNVSSRQVLKVLAVTTAFLGVLYFAFLTRQILGWLIMAFALALALDPAVAWVSRKLPGKNRLVATLIVFIILLALIAGLGLLLIPPLVTQSEQFVRDFPRYTADFTRGGTFTGDIIQRYDLVNRIQDSGSNLASRLTSAGGSLLAVVSGVFSSILATVTVLGLTFFMLIEGPTWMSLLWRTQHNVERRERAQHLAADMYKAVGGYVVGKLVAALLAGISTTIMLIILGVPFAVPLGLIVGIFSILPLVGATIGAAIVLVIALFSGSLTDVIVMAIFFVIYQQIENNVIQPIIFNRTVSVSPLLVFVSVLFGTAVGGIVGALIAIPVTASLQILVKDIYQRRSGEQTLPKPVVTDGKPAKA